MDVYRISGEVTAEEPAVKFTFKDGYYAVDS